MSVAGPLWQSTVEQSVHLVARVGRDVVVAVSDMGAKVERAMQRAEKVEARQLRADTTEIEQDAKTASTDLGARLR
jgi:hypothetical protein